MLRIKPRALAAASLVLALQLLAAVPCAHARPAAAHASSGQAGAHSLLAGAKAWLTRLLAATTGTAGPLTGSCIDPQGTRPCGS